MRNKSTKGFTLIELLIVIAIIGILAAVLIPNLLRAREVAVDRAAEAYAQNVYKAGFAYIAEDPNNSLAANVDCAAGVNGPFGEYTVNAPSLDITQCTYDATTNSVTVKFNGGTAATQPDTVVVGN